jgi:hypothetical protein
MEKTDDIDKIDKLIKIDKYITDRCERYGR